MSLHCHLLHNYLKLISHSSCCFSGSLLASTAATANSAGRAPATNCDGAAVAYSNDRAAAAARAIATANSSVGIAAGQQV